MVNETALQQASWRKTLLLLDSNIQQAISNLDASGLQIVIVVDGEGKLAGTVTDGDIRRGLLKGFGLSNPITDILHRDALVVPPQMNRDMALQLMNANKIRQLPIVDADRNVTGLHSWDDLLVAGSRENLIVVLAGGKGTRLRPFTENCPKPMLQVSGKPMLEHLVERAKLEGFTRFVFAINYLGHMVEEYFQDGGKWQVEIDYLRETTPLGTAGALGLLKNRPSKAMLVTNGDLMTDFRYGELLDFHNQHNAAATMAVRIHEWQNPFGVVQTDGVEITGFEEKPVSRSHINAGIYALHPDALDVVGKDEHCDMPTLFTRLRESSRKTIVFPMHEPWLDIGRPTDLERARSNDARTDSIQPVPPKEAP